MNNSKLQNAILAFVKNKKANAAYYDDNWSERKERKADQIHRDGKTGCGCEESIEGQSSRKRPVHTRVLCRLFQVLFQDCPYKNGHEAMGLDDKEVYSISIDARTNSHPSEEEFPAVLIYLRQEHAGHFDITGKCMTGMLHKECVMPHPVVIEGFFQNQPAGRRDHPVQCPE